MKRGSANFESLLCFSCFCSTTQLMFPSVTPLAVKIFSLYNLSLDNFYSAWTVVLTGATVWWQILYCSWSFIVTLCSDKVRTTWQPLLPWPSMRTLQKVIWGRTFHRVPSVECLDSRLSGRLVSLYKSFWDKQWLYLQQTVQGCLLGNRPLSTLLQDSLASRPKIQLEL